MNTPPPIDPTQVQVGGPTVSAATAQGFPAIAGYEILSELGRGGMGVVYKAKHLNLKRIIALKLMLGDDPLNKARFLAEGQVIAALKHPYVVEVYDFGESSIGPYIAMEYLPKGTFSSLLELGLTPRVAAEQIAKIAMGVGAAHNLNIVHRDLKPGNVLIDANGSPKVTDFGLAKQSTSDLTMTQDAAGTPAYMAPEQARAMKFVGPPADVWSLGVMLYESLTGKRPFTADSNVQLLATIQNDNPPTLRTISKAIPQDLETICLKCLEKEPERRYASANELASDLQAWHEGKPIAAKRAKAVERAMLWVRRKPTVAAAWTLALLVLMLGAFGLTTTKLWREAVDEKGIAEGLKGEAEQSRDDAEGQKKLAMESRDDANAARKRAEIAEAIAKQAKVDIADERERLAYARNVNMAHIAYQNEDFDRAKMFLELCPEKLRGWDWRYVDWICEPVFCSLKGHTGAVTSVAFSPDGTRIVTGSNDSTAKMWDAKTGNEILTLKGHTGAVTSVAFSPDGSQIVTNDCGDFNFQATVKLWNAKTGRETLTLKGHTGEVRSAAFSPDGTRVVTGSGDLTAKVWDAKTGRETLTLKGHVNEVHSVAFSPDGTRIVTGSADHTAKLWDAKTSRETLTLEGHAGRVQSVAFSPDGTRIATGSGDNTAKLWDAKTGIETLTLKGHTGVVNSVAFSPDGTRIVTGSYDETAKLWDAKTGREIRTLKGHRSAVSSVAFSPDGNRIVTGSWENTVKLWDAKTGSETVTLKGHTNIVTSVAFSLDGTRVATGSDDKTAKLWNAKTGSEMHTFRGHTYSVTSVAFSPAGTRVVTGSADTTAKLWDTRTGNETITLTGHTEDVTSVAFSPDGARIVTGSYDKTARIYDATPVNREFLPKAAK